MLSVPLFSRILNSFLLASLRHRHHQMFGGAAAEHNPRPAGMVIGREESGIPPMGGDDHQMGRVDLPLLPGGWLFRLISDALIVTVTRLGAILLTFGSIFGQSATDC